MDEKPETPPAETTPPEPFFLPEIVGASASHANLDCGTNLQPGENKIVMRTIRRATDDTPLTIEAKRILDILADESPVLMTQDGIETKNTEWFQKGKPLVKLTNRTIRIHLKYLKKKGLVTQPLGPKKGWGLTAAGRSILGR